MSLSLFPQFQAGYLVLSTYTRCNPREATYYLQCAQSQGGYLLLSTYKVHTLSVIHAQTCQLCLTTGVYVVSEPPPAMPKQASFKSV